jgi:dCMP deaminase
VVYQIAYKDDSGLQFLEKAGVELEHLPHIMEENEKDQ